MNAAAAVGGIVVGAGAVIAAAVKAWDGRRGQRFLRHKQGRRGKIGNQNGHTKQGHSQAHRLQAAARAGGGRGGEKCSGGPYCHVAFKQEGLEELGRRVV
jgi:hypothetical protein